MTTPAQALAAVQSASTVEALTAAINSLSAASPTPSSSALWSGQAAMGGEPTAGGAVWPSLANESGLQTLQNTPRGMFITQYNNVILMRAETIYQGEAWPEPTFRRGN